MINPEFLSEHLEEYKENLRKRQAKAEHFELEKIVELLWQRKELTRQTQELQAKRNAIANSPEGHEKGKEIKEKIAQLEKISKEAGEKLHNLLVRLPNMAADDVPVGADDKANVVLREAGQKRDILAPKDYLALAGSLIDTARATKVAGTRFGYLFGDMQTLR